MGQEQSRASIASSVVEEGANLGAARSIEHREKKAGYVPRPLLGRQVGTAVMSVSQHKEGCLSCGMC